MSSISLGYFVNPDAADPQPFFEVVDQCGLKLNSKFKKPRFNQYSIIDYADFFDEVRIEDDLETFWPTFYSGIEKDICFWFSSETSDGRKWMEHFSIAIINVPNFGRIYKAGLPCFKSRDAFRNLLSTIDLTLHEFYWIVCRAMGCSSFLSGGGGNEWSQVHSVLKGEKPDHFETYMFTRFSGLSEEATNLLLENNPKLKTMTSKHGDQLIYFTN